MMESHPLQLKKSAWKCCGAMIPEFDSCLPHPHIKDNPIYAQKCLQLLGGDLHEVTWCILAWTLGQALHTLHGQYNKQKCMICQKDDWLYSTPAICSQSPNCHCYSVFNRNWFSRPSWFFRPLWGWSWLQIYTNVSFIIQKFLAGHSHQSHYDNPVPPLWAMSLNPGLPLTSCRWGNH